MRKLLVTTLKTIAFFIGWALLTGVIPLANIESPVLWRFNAELIPLLCVTGISLIFWIIEKRRICIYSISNPIQNSVIGIITGIVWLGSATGILMISGAMQVKGYNTIPMLWLWLLTVLINTIMQELLVRGYLYQMIKLNYNVVTATIVSTALFTFMHSGAFEAGIIPVMNVLTMSLLMTVILEYTGSLLTPIIIHFLWNGVGAVILGGVSLAEDYPHLLTTSFKGNSLVSGGVYKIEGSIVVLFLNITLMTGFLLMLHKKRNLYKKGIPK